MTIGHIHSGTFEKFLSKQTCKRKLQLLPFSDCSWAGASWLFFRVARSTRMTQIWVLYRLSGSDRLEKQPTDLRQYTCYFGDRTLALAWIAHKSWYLTRNPNHRYSSVVVRREVEIPRMYCARSNAAGSEQFQFF